MFISQRRSIRLSGHDYSASGAYFVTICAKRHECHFGTIDGGAMAANAAGRLFESIWRSLPTRFVRLTLDAFALIPNHLHGILVLGDGTGEAPNGPWTRKTRSITRRGEPCVRPVFQGRKWG